MAAYMVSTADDVLCIEADSIEISEAGVLLFRTDADPPANLVVAVSPSSWRSVHPGALEAPEIERRSGDHQLGSGSLARTDGP